MKILVTAILASVGLCGGTLAQEPAPAGANNTPQAQQAVPSGQSDSERNAAASRIAPGSVIPVQLMKSVDAKKVKSGDEVDAKVTEDMKTANGEVIVPKDTKVVGHVTEAQTRSKEQKESQITIAFDHAQMKNGSDVSLPMSIQAIVGPRNPNSNPGTDQSSSGEAGKYPSGNSRRSAGAPSGSMGQSPNPSTNSETPNSTPAATSAPPPITGSTQGVVGISDLKLSPAANTTQGSVVSSEKNNVKLESGTLLLLRVNP